MEVLDGMTDKIGNHVTSAAAFVEGGIQDACDDACSNCLEEFCDNDPSTVITCKHDFHLQCILEWCQRSSQCPMCMQQISLKDPTNQELFQAVERERSIKNAPFPVGANDPDLDERIIQHLAAAAATGRTHHLSRRDGHRGRSAGHGQLHFLHLSHQSNAPHSSPVSLYVGGSEQDNVTIPRPSIPVASSDGASSHQIFVQSGRLPSLASGSRVNSASRNRVVLSNRGSLTSPPVRDGTNPSDFQAFSESLKSKLNAVSIQGITLQEYQRMEGSVFSSQRPMADQRDTENRREVNGRVNLVSHLMDNLEIREDTAASATSESSENSANVYSRDSTIHCSAENSLVEENPSESCPPCSVSS